MEWINATDKQKSAILAWLEYIDAHFASNFNCDNYSRIKDWEEMMELRKNIKLKQPVFPITLKQIDIMVDFLSDEMLAGHYKNVYPHWQKAIDEVKPYRHLFFDLHKQVEATRAKRSAQRLRKKSKSNLDNKATSNKNKDYEPLGPEWERQVMQMRKSDIVAMLKRALSKQFKQETESGQITFLIFDESKDLEQSNN